MKLEQLSELDSLLPQELPTTITGPGTYPLMTNPWMEMTNPCMEIELPTSRYHVLRTAMYKGME